MVMFERLWEVNGSVTSIKATLEAQMESDASIHYLESPRLIAEPGSQRFMSVPSYPVVFAVSDKPLPNEPCVVIRLFPKGRKKTRIFASCESPYVGDFFKHVIEPMIEQCAS
jgi:hypothetical protein